MYAARKTLLTGTDILTDTSQARLDALFACPNHADVHTTWRIYQDLLAAYRDRDPRRGKNTLRQLITTITRPDLPHTCIELARMGRTLKRRARDILAYFDHPHTTGGPTEAIKGRLEHIRDIAQGFINHRDYRLRCLLHSGGFQHLLHPQMRRAVLPVPGCSSVLLCRYVLISHARRSPMSHVIPLHIFQTLKYVRWNCNVCGPSRKMTELNYVRN